MTWTQECPIGQLKRDEKHEKWRHLVCVFVRSLSYIPFLLCIRNCICRLILLPVRWILWENSDYHFSSGDWKSLGYLAKHAFFRDFIFSLLFQMQNDVYPTLHNIQLHNIPANPSCPTWRRKGIKEASTEMIKDVACRWPTCMLLHAQTLLLFFPFQSQPVMKSDWSTSHV